MLQKNITIQVRKWLIFNELLRHLSNKNFMVIATRGSKNKKGLNFILICPYLQFMKALSSLVKTNLKYKY